jgi:hypothetical protein
MVVLLCYPLTLPLPVNLSKRNLHSVVTISRNACTSALCDDRFDEPDLRICRLAHAGFAFNRNKHTIGRNADDVARTNAQAEFDGPAVLVWQLARVIPPSCTPAR